jgi:hypothetical protein
MGKACGMKRRATGLIKSPLDWHMAAAPVPHPVIPVLAERGGTQLRTPRCTVVVDTREQNPFDLSRFEGVVCRSRNESPELGRLFDRGAGRPLCGGAEGPTRPHVLLHR